MSQNTAAAERTTGDSEPLAARVRDLLRRYNPIYLGPLGFLSLPAEWSDQLQFLELFGVFYLFFLWILVGPLVDLALRSRIETESEPTDWIDAGDWKEMVVALLTMPLVFLNPLAVIQDITQFAGSWLAGLLRHRGSLPDADSYEQSVAYRLPFEGAWTVVNGSPEREYSHSWIYPSQRYAYDFLITDDDGNSRPEGASATVEEYYCYDEPVLAPADGVVVDAFDAALESTRAGGFSHPAGRDIRGGYVVIKHASEEFSLLAHLKPGSVPVEAGERVRRGQEVGRCGHSGNSTEPHLHFQVQDHPTFELATTLPVQFDTVNVDSPGVAHDGGLVPGTAVSDGTHEQAYIVAGQRVAHAAEGARETDDLSEPVRSEPPTGDSGTSSLQRVKRTAFGLSVAGAVLFVGRIFLSGWPLVAALAAAGAVGLLFGFAYRRLHEGVETRSPGVSLAFGIAAVLVASLLSVGVGSGVVVGPLLVSGVLGYAAIGEYERRQLPRVTRTATQL